MPSVIRITAIFPYTTGIAADTAQNTFHFLSAGDDREESMFDFWIAELESFYNDNHIEDSAAPLSSCMSGVIDHSHCRFDVAGVNPITGVVNPVVASHTWTLGASLQDAAHYDLPLEVAVAGSYNCDRTIYPGPAGRRRGRIFLGPLTSFAIEGLTTTPPHVYPNPSLQLRQQLVGAMHGLVTAAETGVPGGIADTGEWCLYTRPSAGRAAQAALPGDPAHTALPAHVGAMIPISDVSCDNEWDTQRRRGTKATARYTTMRNGDHHGS